MGGVSCSIYDTRAVTQRLRFGAWLCLLTFSVGSVVAPASHYAFMAIAGAYGYGQHHSAEEHDEPADPHAHHGHHMAMAMPSMEGGQVDAPQAAHEMCEYAELYATQVLASAPAPLTLPIPESRLALAEAPLVVLPADAPLTHFSRGPPLV
ncbi:MAG: hypothetical protein RhofKO_30510 [Rhodothermales bacterium]